MLALHGHVIVAWLRNLFRIVIDSRFFGVHVAVFEPEDPNVLHLGVPGLVVFVDAAVHASPAAYAALDVQTVSEKGPVDGRFSPHYEVFAVFLFVFCPEALYRLFDLFLGHSLEMVLREFLPRARTHGNQSQESSGSGQKGTPVRLCHVGSRVGVPIFEPVPSCWMALFSFAILCESLIALNLQCLAWVSLGVQGFWGGGMGSMGLNLGVCGLWHVTHR